jgi:tRNA 2-thiouridine synthesizing protein A
VLEIAMAADAIHEDRLLDARGLLCPMPVVKAGKEMRGMQPGQILKILATDRGAIADFPAWAEDAGHQLLASGDEAGTLVFYVRKGDS